MSWGKSRSYRKSEQTKILPRMSTITSSIMMVGWPGKAWGKPRGCLHTPFGMFHPMRSPGGFRLYGPAHCLHHPWIWPFTGNLLPPHSTSTA